MNNLVKVAGATAIAALVGLTAIAPAVAAPRPGNNDWWLMQHNGQHVGQRHWNGGHNYGHPYYRGGGYYNGGYYNNGYYGGYDPGFDVTAGLIGGIFGTIAGAAIANGGSGGSHVARCENTYRSYRPATNTYTGYDGKTYVCRL
ncbi:MAG: BA14K family protein [Devosia sp.]